MAIKTDSYSEVEIKKSQDCDIFFVIFYNVQFLLFRFAISFVKNHFCIFNYYMKFNMVVKFCPLSALISMHLSGHSSCLFTSSPAHQRTLYLAHGTRLTPFLSLAPAAVLSTFSLSSASLCILLRFLHYNHYF